MDDAGTRKVTPHKATHAVPRPTMATALTTSANHTKPITSYLVHETADAMSVARDGMIVQPALHNRPQPTSRFAKRPVHSLPQRRLDRLERPAHAFRH